MYTEYFKHACWLLLVENYIILRLMSSDVCAYMVIVIWCKIRWWMSYVIIVSLDIHLASWKLCILWF